MAFPALRGTPVTALSTSDTTAPTVNAPTGIADGDVWAMFVNMQGSAGSPTLTIPSGWTSVPTAGVGPNGGIMSYLIWKVWHTGDATSQALSFTANSAYGIISFAYSGANAATPFGTEQAAQDTSNDTTLTVPSLTTTGTDSLSLVMGGLGSNSTTMTVQPSGYTSVATIGGKRAQLSSAQRASGTTTGALSFTTSGAARGNVIHIELFTAPSLAAPVNSIAPAVSGDAEVGATLTTDDGTWTGYPPPVFTYQWQRDTGGGFSDIVGETASTYELGSGDAGADVRCRVTATNSQGAATASSNEIGPVTEPINEDVMVRVSGAWVATDSKVRRDGDWI